MAANPQTSGPQAARPQASSARLIDSETLLGIEPLDLRARLIVEGFLTGLHRSPYHGFSVEFSEYRPYSQGDDLRYLDWRLLARTDRRYIKRFEDETNVRCHLLVDLSRSMAFGHERRPKAEHAVTLAATLAYFLAKQRDAVGLMTFADDVLEFIPARYRPGHLHRVLAALERGASGASTGLAASLEHVAGLVKKRGVVVLVSDLLTPTAGLDVALGQLRARGQEVILFRVLDPAEVDFPFDAAARFEDLEDGRSFYVDPKTAAATYRQRFAEHEAELVRTCNEHSVDLIRWTTDRPLGECLPEYLQARDRRGRTVLRRAGARGAR